MILSQSEVDKLVNQMVNIILTSFMIVLSLWLVSTLFPSKFDIFLEDIRSLILFISQLFGA